MTDRDMSQDFETFGTWFIPENPDRRSAGTLACRSERIELALSDSLAPMQSGPIRAEFVEYPVVHGISREQEAISLFRCVRTGYSLTFASGGFGRPEKYWSHLAVFGAHVKPGQLYPELRCRVPGLEIWLSPRSIETVRDEAGISFRVKKFPSEKIAIPSIESELEFNIYGIGSPAHSKATITASGWLSIKPSTPRTLDWYLDQLWKACGLLAFFAEKPMPPDRIELRIDSSHGFVLSVLTGRPSAKYCDHSEHHDFFASRTRLGDELASVVPTWFQLFPQVERPANLALSTMASEQIWAHVLFLSLMQSLEGLHRALFPGLYLDAAKYKSVLQVLLDAIPKSLGQDHRASLESRLRYGNEISLAKRLAQLVELLPVELRKRIVGAEKVPRSWVDTRNYYTHWDEGIRSDILEGQAMYDVSVRLTILLRILYLYKAGVGGATLASSLDGRSAAALHLAQLNAKQQSEADDDL
ncbi:hypothetical protein N2603_39455 [Bradyrhizobium huanghuaihaiense]|uniref:ApeA N-terminal domain 1-containing protein n=1 Tax=Bradyrhizobium huanghuaihaiense TaxID=990078 RepID=UPI0021A9F1FA|nr:HEPN domain-containing protein [Bradyrhizobium sp. CB3035]UWU75950.1 hypothetical protein N2603_39455 [Bradyrhizobium sp. CB3035]